MNRPLTDDQVRAIRLAHAQYITQNPYGRGIGAAGMKAIATEYGIGFNTVYQIVTRRTYADVPQYATGGVLAADSSPLAGAPDGCILPPPDRVGYHRQMAQMFLSA